MSYSRSRISPYSHTLPIGGPNDHRSKTTLYRRKWSIFTLISTTLIVIILLQLSKFHSTAPAIASIIENESIPSVDTPLQIQEEFHPQIKHTEPPKRLAVCSNPQRDEMLDNLHLTEAQCHETFGSKLWQEIDYASHYYKERGSITKQEVEEAMKDSTLTLIISKERIYVKDYEWAPESRALATLQSLREAVTTFLL